MTGPGGERTTPNAATNDRSPHNERKSSLAKRALVATNLRLRSNNALLTLRSHGDRRLWRRGEVVKRNQGFSQRPSRRSIALGGLACLATELAGCAKGVSYRFKLTISVETPQGNRNGYSVVELAMAAVSIPASGEMTSIKGAALYLDLNGKPLIAILGGGAPLWVKKGDFWWPGDWDEYNSVERAHPAWAKWEGASPTKIFEHAYFHDSRPSISGIEVIQRIAAIRKPVKLAPDQLPALVTFADVNDPKTAAQVDPLDLEATFGPGVMWGPLTVEITDEKLTSGIETKLPWLKTMPGNITLAGQLGMRFPPPDISSTLQRSHFIHQDFF